MRARVRSTLVAVCGCSVLPSPTMLRPRRCITCRERDAALWLRLDADHAIAHLQIGRRRVVQHRSGRRKDLPQALACTCFGGAAGSLQRRVAEAAGSNGAASVSPDTARTDVSGIPSVSATIIGIVVRRPWPISVDAKKTTTEPSLNDLDRGTALTATAPALGEREADAARFRSRLTGAGNGVTAGPPDLRRAFLDAAVEHLRDEPAVFDAGAAARDRIAGALDVLQTERDRIPAHLVGDLVEQRLDPETSPADRRRRVSGPCSGRLCGRGSAPSARAAPCRCALTGCRGRPGACDRRPG